MPLGEIISGEIETPGAEDVYTFDAESGTLISLDMQQIWQSERNVNESLVAKLYAPDGSVLHSRTDFLHQAHDLGPLELPATGTYTLQFRGNGDNIPGYQLRIDDVTPGSAAPIALDQIVSDAIDVGGRTRSYTFAATSGDELTLDILFNEIVDRIGGPTAGFTLAAPSGTVLADSGFNDATFTATETGEYLLIVDDRDFVRRSDITATYSFRIASDPQAPEPAAANLVISDVVADLVSVGSPAQLNVSWTVTNTGNATAQGWNASGWTDQIILSAEDTAGVLDRVFAEVDRSEDLAPGASYTASATITLPAETEGSFWVYAEADPLNQVYESEPVTDNRTRAENSSTVYRQARPEHAGPAIKLTPGDGSRYPTGTSLALSGSAAASNQSINAIFMIDVSGSTLEPSGLDVNGDGVIDANDDLNDFDNVGDVLDAEIAAALRLTQQLQVLSDDVRVASVMFAGGSEPLDAGPEPFNQNFVDPRDDTTYRDDQPNFETAITSLWSQSLSFLSLQGASRFRDMEVRAGTEFEPVMRDVENLPHRLIPSGQRRRCSCARGSVP